MGGFNLLVSRYRPGKEMKGVKWPFFAVYMVLTKPGEIKVGDMVHKIE